MITLRNKNLAILLIAFAFPFMAFSKQSEVKVFFDDQEQIITDFEGAQNFCSSVLGGTLPDAQSLQEIIINLGERLKPAHYWSTTPGADCGAEECRIQIEVPTHEQRSENVKNATGALICITQYDDGE